MTLAPLRAAARSHRGRPVGLAPTEAPVDGAVVVLHDVTKTYPNGNVALRDVDLVVPEGDFVFLVGPSGAGKSTLIKLLIRDEIATEGAVILDGQDLARLARREVPRIRRKIGIIFQDFKLLPTKTVRENVAFALEVTGTPRRQIGPAVDRVLALVGLTAQARQLPSTLSGGEQQRTAIARALVHDPAPDHRRRADRQPRPAHQLGDHPAAVADQRARRDGPDGDPQRRDRDRPPPAGRRPRGRPDHPRRGRRGLPP